LHVYLQGLIYHLTALPAYYPQHLRTATTTQTGFETISQMVQVVDERTGLERQRAEERERLRTHGSNPDALAYAPHRARPEWDMETARPSSPLIPWDDKAGARFPRAVILGDPGFGKTWLLRYEACRLARQAIAQLRDKTGTLADIHVPIFMPLRLLNQSDDPIADALVTYVAGPQSSGALRHFVQQRLHTTHYTILLDSWDEVPVEEPSAGQPVVYAPHRRQRLGQRLEAFARQYPQPRLLLTSRIVGYTGSPISNAQELELIAFDWSQVEAFVRVWLGNDEAKTQRVLAQLGQHPLVRGLARIPLMLSLLCRTAQENP
jgi:predicted NACHT family NTPase